MENSIYLIGSLRNPEVPKVAESLRSAGFDVYDDWWSASEDADDWLQSYYKRRGFTHKQMLNAIASKHIFELDFRHLNRCQIGVLLMPAGKSGHIELGYMIGQGKPGYILFDKEPERFDQMHQFAKDVFYNVEELVNGIVADRNGRTQNSNGSRILGVGEQGGENRPNALRTVRGLGGSPETGTVEQAPSLLSRNGRAS